MFDKWAPTLTSIRDLGLKHAPPVNHSKHFRDPETGYHTNDVESENERFKRCIRGRSGRVHVEDSDLEEYMYYVNVGASMESVLTGLRIASEGES